ncbi:GNAT family N-acetyltransferase [Actinotalea ferrariae]|uniref:GNAT family N-acetyltransferase n=1 Tax=Actinotalea ferrariae TaxID=1386098 RepID=UPI001C8C2656|nr:GNAT family N-acetyltransferase [Actinotalea ferrariae]MBX9246023.1 GNAT family N-acetyltransferase [Actinotalea ferrariae]
MELRPYRATDRDDVYDVCVRTADGGGDARGQYTTDDFMPDLFAGPYLFLEPELAFVLDDGDRVVGYVLGTADTARWAAEHRARWLPRVAARYPLPDRGAGSPDPHPGRPATPQEGLTELLHHPERNVYAELAGYPAHLHIDVLPAHQGAGHGRALIRTFLAALRERGVPAVHLGMVTTNTPARAFYDRLGFHEIALEVPGLTFLGAPTDLAV